MSSTTVLLTVVVTVAVLIAGLAEALPMPTNANGPAAFVVQPNTAENLAVLAAGNYPQNIEELSGQFEGDMVLNTEQQLLVDGLLPTVRDNERTGLIDERYRWPGNTVPVVLSEGQFDEAQTQHVYKALRTIESISCLRFVNRTLEENYVQMTTNNSGCYSNVGHLNGGRQSVNLQQYAVDSGCFRLGTIIHEFLHTLGFYHMQSATERDDFVRIAWEHMTPGTESNFNKYEADRITNFGHTYDVTSIMHYSAYGFSKNGYATIIPNDISLIDVLGQRVAMTDRDIARLNTMYKCDV